MRRIIEILGLAALTACAPAETDTVAADAASVTEAASITDTARLPDANAPDRAGLRTVLFVGTSLTAGYGVDISDAYPSALQQRIDSAGLPFRVVNAGISGETSAGGLRRIDWALQQPVDVLVIELGANDGLRGVAPEELRRNLDEILATARERHPDVALVLVGMEAPPNLGDDYTGRFRTVFTELAAEHDAALVPFLLEGVAGQPSLNIEDGIHPNAAGHQRLAATVWPALEPVLRDRATRPAAAPVDQGASSDES